MRSYLVIANQTLVSDTVVDKVYELVDGGSSRFHIVVPATRQQERLTWTEGAAWAVARRRLEMALIRFGRLNAEVSGEVGDENPVLAALDAMRVASFDEVILCTLPPGISAWLKKDLPTRLQRRITIPVKHLPVARQAAIELPFGVAEQERGAA